METVNAVEILRDYGRKMTVGTRAMLANEMSRYAHANQEQAKELAVLRERLSVAELARDSWKREAETNEWIALYEFAGWLSENGEDLHELPNEAVIAIVDRFLAERKKRDG